MSLLKKSQTPFETDENEDLEELYKKLFMKMGRDFVHKDDLLNILRLILSFIDPAGISIGALSNFDSLEAKQRALQYKQDLESGDSARKYQDLIDLDEE